MSKLYMKKLEEMVAKQSAGDESQLNMCVYCKKLFTQEQRKWQVCQRAKIFIDFHGEAIAEHMSDRHFQMKNLVTFMRNENLGYKDIFWKIWAATISFDCM